MPAYIVVDAVIHDRVAFAAYGTETAKIVTRMGGRYLVLGGGQMETLEGSGFAGKAVVSEWPDKAAALAFWNSPEYALARKLREGICDARVVLVEGIGATSPAPKGDGS
jgi:uncharacterized protein (DUF1330 family)